MSEVTHILNAIEQGDPSAAEQLLPLVYDELRKLAAAKLAQEKPGQTLDATALVHEAYLRLVASGGSPSPEDPQRWHGRRHFFAAAAEAMRRILVENARRKARLKRGGDLVRQEVDPSLIAISESVDDLLALDDALERLGQLDPRKAELVKLRYFAGLTMPRAAEALGISLSSAEKDWTYARTWLYRQITQGDMDREKPQG
jgi:RNA polymerase sigma factor (TIGR02999 family)